MADKRTKAHAIKFTDADWKYIQQQAELSGWTPAYYVNFMLGWQATQNGRKWEGLESRGWPKGKKRKPTP